MGFDARQCPSARADGCMCLTGALKGSRRGSHTDADVAPFRRRDIPGAGQSRGGAALGQGTVRLGMRWPMGSLVHLLRGSEPPLVEKQKKAKGQASRGRNHKGVLSWLKQRDGQSMIS